MQRRADGGVLGTNRPSGLGERETRVENEAFHRLVHEARRTGNAASLVHSLSAVQTCACAAFLILLMFVFTASGFELVKYSDPLSL